MNTVVISRRRDPFADFDALFRTAFAPVTRSMGFSPAAEVSRDGEDAVVRVELPGLDIERDITVEVDRNRLVVRGERRDERSEHSAGRVLREVRYGSFHRSFSLPAHVTDDDVTARYDTGVLSVRVAGAYAGSTPRRIAVTAAGSATAGSTESAADGTEPQVAAPVEDEQAA
jgi:HSP20 family protein